MTSLGYTIKSRGVLNTFQRVWYLYKYFGLGSGRAKQAIKELIDMCNSYGLKPTFPVPKTITPVFFNNLDLISSTLSMLILNPDKIKIRNPRLEHEVKFSNKPKSTELKIHVYYKLFLGIIDKKVSWNEVQNHCLFDQSLNL